MLPVLFDHLEFPALGVDQPPPLIDINALHPFPNLRQLGLQVFFPLLPELRRLFVYLTFDLVQAGGVLAAAFQVGPELLEEFLEEGQGRLGGIGVRRGIAVVLGPADHRFQRLRRFALRVNRLFSGPDAEEVGDRFHHRITLFSLPRQEQGHRRLGVGLLSVSLFQTLSSATLCLLSQRLPISVGLFAHLLRQEDAQRLAGFLTHYAGGLRIGHPPGQAVGQRLSGLRIHRLDRVAAGHQPERGVDRQDRLL